MFLMFAGQFCVVQKDNMTVFAGGQLRPGTEKEVPNRRRKWAVPGAAQGNAVFMGDK